MSAVVIDPPKLLSAHRVPDARPPALTWARAIRPAPPEQPVLFEAPANQLSGAPRPRGHRARVVALPPVGPPPEGLPDAAAWSSSLALGVAETLQGRRPVSQLARWVDERVLARVTVGLRRRRRDPASTDPSRSHGPLAPARLHSVHLQFPQVGVVEVSAHVQLGDRSSALAMRLEAWHDRWLCTALELGPRDCEL